MEKLERINQFFECDLEIKKILHTLVPNLTDGYNKEYVFKYSDRLFKELKIIKYYIIRIMNSFNISNTEFIDKMFEKYENDLSIIGPDFNKLCDFYKNNLSDMSIEFVNTVNSNCVGYTIIKQNLINKAKTVNEMLHFLHHYIINNEEYYMSIPKIEEKVNFEKNEIVLRGMETNLSKLLFESIPNELSLGTTDIISLQDKALIMVRDRGHALTIEITNEGNECSVRYFIPKICNYLMVNNLKGVNKTNEDSNFTVGFFVCDIDSLPYEIVNLISNVPMDDHMFIEGGINYNPNIKTI